MRIPSLLPLLALALFTALPARAKEGEAPALGAPERALLQLLRPTAKGTTLKEGEVTPGRFLVALATVELPGQRKAVVILTSERPPEDEGSANPALEAELSVVSGGDAPPQVLARERISTPFGAGRLQVSASTPTLGKKGEAVIRVSLGRDSDGEGSIVEDSFFHLAAGTGGEGAALKPLLQFRYTPRSGSGYPHEQEEVTLEERPSRYDGYSDLLIVAKGNYCDTEKDCWDTKKVERICWMGTRYTSENDCLVSKVTASSQLKASKADGPTYYPDNVLDGESSTAWCEGAKGTGRGEWLKFEFHSPVTVEELTLVAGYDKSPDVWRNNARLKSVRLHFPDNTHEDADLTDTVSPQDLQLERTSAFESVKLEVLAVYPGRRFADACVSEVGFSGVELAPAAQE